MIPILYLRLYVMLHQYLTVFCSVPQMENINSNRVPPTIVKLTKRLGLDATELMNQVEFCVPQPAMFKHTHHVLESDQVQPAPQVTVLGVASPLDFAAHQSAYSETDFANLPTPVTTPELRSPPPVPAQHSAAPTPPPVPAGGPGEPVQLHATSAGGPEESVQPHATSAGGPRAPIHYLSVSADSSESIQPSTASPPATPMPVLPRPRPVWHQRPPSRPLTGLLRRRGRPLDLLRRHRWLRGRLPELFSHELLSRWPPGRPPHLSFWTVPCAFVGHFVFDLVLALQPGPPPAALGGLFLVLFSRLGASGIRP
ncbi:uncharacterized protein LOC112846304 [Oreochromis niloticus]|uniref:uncharacterized protein LOC112846304 n=1 Tax=Oreochromis niloticus TaxID=8128 RepID=UPI000DF3A4D7|nr:uncharacterized protein LOC112846304 [Oreochromis niloticus]XP_025761591.1 uncharacterized protein LOC112846304 [Oreochromis niloticus]